MRRAWQRPVIARPRATSQPSPAECEPRRPGGGGRACAPRCCSACSALVALLARSWRTSRPTGCGSTSSARSASSGRCSRRKWLAGSLAGLGTTTLLLANFWVVERTAPRRRRLRAATQPSRRLRRDLCPLSRRYRPARGCWSGAASCARGLAAGHALAPPQRLRRDRSAVPPGRRLLRLLAAAVPEGRALAVR